MIRLQSISSWMGALLILLLLFVIWYFVFRSNISDGSALLPKEVCTKEYPRERESFFDWEVFYYKKGCARIDGSQTLRQLLSWLEEDSLLIAERFSLPEPEKGSAILFWQNDSWKTFVSQKSSPAIATLGTNSFLGRYYLDSALIDLALREKYPKISSTRPISESLALDLKHNRFLAEKRPLSLSSQEIIALLDRCRDSACETPLQSNE